MIDPANVAFFVPNELKRFKQKLFDRIAKHIEAAGGIAVRGDHLALDKLPDSVIPIVGAAPYLLPLVRGWRARGRTWIGWDRGYARRVFATWLPPGENGGYYRWTIGAYQMRHIRDVPGDRWAALETPVLPWRKSGKHIVVALPAPTYRLSHDDADDWVERTRADLAMVTDRPVILREKLSPRSLQADLEGAHCLVAHGSMAAVEAVICGCPVFVHPDSAAALVGMTELTMIESPIYPDREPWLWSLAYSQWDEKELVDGTLWRQLV